MLRHHRNINVSLGRFYARYSLPPPGSTEELARNPDGSIEITKKEKKREEKFSKIFDDISSDIMAGFL